MRFMLTLLVLGILVFASYYMFVSGKFKGSPKTQIEQTLNSTEEKDSAIEAEVGEMTIKFGLTPDQQQLIQEKLVREKQQIIAVLKDRSLTKQQQNEKINKIQKFHHVGIAALLTNEAGKRQEIQQWLISRETKILENNTP